MRVVLAAGPDKRLITGFARAGVRSILMSYWYLKDMSKQRSKELLQMARDGGLWVMIDSGAHTFFGEYWWLDPRSNHAVDATAQEKAEAAKGHDPKRALIEIDEYMRRYIEWTAEVKDLVDAWAELDIDPLVGMQNVYRWREWWADANLTENLIVTIHPTASSATGQKHVPFSAPHGQQRSDVEEMMSGKYRYVGVNAGEDASVYDWVWATYLPVMRERKILLHGWGMTTQKAYAQPWYSVDSSSWAAWGRWGLIYYWEPDRLRMNNFPGSARHPPMEQRMLLRACDAEAEALGIDVDKWRDLDNHAVDLWNAGQWAKLQVHMEADLRNAYWLSDDERGAAVDEKREQNAIVVLDGPQTERRFVPKEFEEKTIVLPPQLTFGRFCKTCVIQDKCPAFRKDPGATCSVTELRWLGDRASIKEALTLLVSQQFERVQFAFLKERIDGGFVDQNASAEFDRFLGALERIDRLGDRRDEVLIRAKGSGVISQLFGKLLAGANTTSKE